MFSYPVVYVDIETTGGSARTSRVLEVAAVRVEPDGVTKEFSAILDPESYIPAAITRLTGIEAADVEGAPRFDDIADQLLDILSGAVFIAHNVRFDYSFLKMEFERIGVLFSPKLVCTVRLSRALYRLEKGHSLAKLIERHEIPVLQRHRALADALAIKYFVELAFEQHGGDVFDEMVERQLRTQYLPSNLDLEELRAIGDEPGVYVFKDENGQPLYVGKSITLRKRILSHFRDTSLKELKISQAVHHVETIPTGSELAALVLESRLVKELQPLFNRQLRRIRHYALLQKGEDQGYATLKVRSAAIDETTVLSEVYGVYETRTKAKAKVLDLTRTYELCPKRMGLEKSSGACFSFSLGRCRGACIGNEPSQSYNRRFEIALEHHRIASWPYKQAISIPINESGEQVVVNNWIVHGYISSEGEYIYDESITSFDVDEYKIIRRFMRENKHLVRELDD